LVKSSFLYINGAKSAVFSPVVTHGKPSGVRLCSCCGHSALQQNATHNEADYADHIECTVRNATLFWSFPYVCPEPVLAKSSFLYINGAKMAFSYLYKSSVRSVSSTWSRHLEPLVSPPPLYADA
jgi:hypothetical protein